MAEYCNVLYYLSYVLRVLETTAAAATSTVNNWNTIAKGSPWHLPYRLPHWPGKLESQGKDDDDDAS
jgi:hypothetical protein